jgi:hypothetical protein
MITIEKSEGNKLEIANGSHIYIKSDSKDFFTEWCQLDQDIQLQMIDLVDRAEDMLKQIELF